MAEFPRIEPGQTIALDYETTGLEYWLPDFRVLGVALATTDASWYFDVRTTSGLIQWLRDILPNRQIVAQFAQFEIQCSRVLGVDPRTIDWYCTMTVECLINEHQLQYDLYSICGYHGIDSQKHAHLDAIQAAMGVCSHGEVLARIAEAPPDMVSAYGASDARDAMEVYLAQKVEIANQGLQRVVRLECDLIPVLANMSWHGIRVDLEAAHASIPALDEQERVLQAETNEIVGKPFNVNSTPQLRDFFKPEPISKYQWRLIDGTIVGPTKGGKGPSLGQDALRTIQHPLAAKILDLRKTIKLRDTFVRGHVIGSADGDGYVHTQFNQTRNDADAGTVTGRLSSTGPALQQITKRDKKNAAILRAMFLPDLGDQWLCEDYSQVDFRCGAHLQNDPSVIAAYANDPTLDYHQIVSDMTGIPRNPPFAGAPNTKQINLGLSFGAGAGKLAFMMGMPYEVKEYKDKMSYLPGSEASRIFEMYHAKLPAVKTFMKKAENVARDTGYVRTALGRRLRFSRGVGAHKAAGLLYQAYAADLHKLGLVAVDHVIRDRNLPARLMMSCHDEIGVSTQPDPAIRDLIRECYTDFNSDNSPVRMRVPITASAEFGANWYEASK
ncbi:PolA DNA polymerase I - 3'-5' exonuclease and polymerase domains [uncultured Caudovirales phage]|uniref:PolA DNA polymerase I - 3'-5' exonuclease and polymerase domains n=1 Tax=uncultured Caudovirales phage TaxID=2100421 RepID=A0A6J5KJ15_9CAUD|nr:PolA DNA polymerase I - 3'-5' exonuclease and polymerase domains [uncultured Caudovirales phage]